MNLIDDILSSTVNSDLDTIMRCIAKSNIVIYKLGIWLIADDEYIYYFGANKDSRTHSKLGRFIKEYGEYADGKKLYTTVPDYFKNRLELLDKEKNLYRWRKDR
jgi:hypothetical protein